MKSRRLNVSEDSLTTSMNGREKSLLIPMDLIVEIFSWLPAKTIARFRCLSKPCASILRLPYFTELSLTKSYARPQLLIAYKKDNEVLFFSSPRPLNLDENSPAVVASSLGHFPTSNEILGPINGFVCLRWQWMLKDRMLPVSVSVICNPSTGQSLALPKMKTRRRYGLKSFFAYDPIEKQFKLLSMTWLVYGRNKSFEEYQVLTLGTGKPSWRMIKCCTPHFSSHKGIYINGVLYYKAAANTTNSMVSMIVCFDVRSEKFKFIEVGGINFHDGTLINYKGKLGSLVSEGSCYVTERSRSITLCVLEDVEKQEWSEHIYLLPALCQSLVGPQHYLNFVGVTRTNEIVLSPRYQNAGFYVFYYNFERNTLIRVEIHGMEECFGKEVYNYLDHLENVQLLQGF